MVNCAYTCCVLHPTTYCYVHVINVVVIITQPTDDTVCLTQSATATFTCVVDRGDVGITNAGWHILDGGVYVDIGGRPRHIDSTSRNGDIITDRLTITNVSVNDNGALYRCEPLSDVTSIPVTITVLGTYMHLSCN